MRKMPHKHIKTCHLYPWKHVSLICLNFFGSKSFPNIAVYLKLNVKSARLIYIPISQSLL